ncbi:MAG: putative hydro-lyase [Pseudomonadota bacterium]
MNERFEPALSLSPAALRREIREARRGGHTAGLAPGYLQGNLAVLPEALAGDFQRFCQRNPKPCPLLGVTDVGSPRVPGLGEDLDLRTDLAGYRVFRRGVEGFEARTDLSEIWRDDLVGFVIGCSYSFEEALMRAGLELGHIRAARNVPMYETSIETAPAGPFGGPMVVSMRPFTPKAAIRAIALSERFPMAHGAPVHFGDPAAIGIADLDRPDYGDPPDMRPGEVPVFWACGVTPQVAIRRAMPEIAAVHEPGHMLITDLLADAAG